MSKRLFINVKKVDFFKADKALSKTVVDFWKARLVRAELAERFRIAIAECDNTVKQCNDILVNGSSVMSADESKALIAKMIARKDELTAEYDENKKNLPNSIIYTDTEKAFISAMKTANNNADIRKAVVEYFKVYKLDVTDTDFLSEVVNKCYAVKVDTKTFITSEGKKSVVNDTTSMLNRMIAITFDKMVEVGTIKTAQIPSVLRDKYAKKKGKGNK